MGTSKNEKSKRKFGKNVQTWHRFYKTKGVYPFLLKNSVRLLIGLGGLVLLLYLLNDHLPDFDYYFELLTVKLRPLSILAIFFLSESILGLLPPDFFILWARQFQSEYGMVALLSVISYAGGVISYIIGIYIGSLPKIQAWLQKKFLSHITQIQTWGGILIVFAALFPLPYSPVCIAAGMLRFPVRMFLLLGLFRLVRFFVYAFVLFKVI